MGSFVGHIDESIFFLLLGIWWMVNKFPRYIRVSKESVTEAPRFMGGGWIEEKQEVEEERREGVEKGGVERLKEY